jgi:predicted nucleic acid-binding protein
VKISISDACIFLDLFELELIADFFNLNVEIHAPLEVINELFPHQKQQLKPYLEAGKISIHILDMNDWQAISLRKYPDTICYNDKIALYLSDKLNCLLLSSDKLVRQIAKQKSIEYHGLLWIFDRLIEQNKITKQDAIAKLSLLPKSNRMYKQNVDFINEIRRRIDSWQT